MVSINGLALENNMFAAADMASISYVLCASLPPNAEYAEFAYGPRETRTRGLARPTA